MKTCVRTVLAVSVVAALLVSALALKAPHFRIRRITQRQLYQIEIRLQGRQEWQELTADNGELRFVWQYITNSVHVTPGERGLTSTGCVVSTHCSISLPGCRVAIPLPFLAESVFESPLVPHGATLELHDGRRVPLRPPVPSEVSPGISILWSAASNPYAVFTDAYTLAELTGLCR